MKRSTAIAAALLVSAIGMSAVAPAQAQMPKKHQGGQMMQKQEAVQDHSMMGAMMGQMMSHMMKQGGMMHQGMMGSKSGFRREKPLSNDEIRRAVDGKLVLAGLSRLKIGTVADDGDAAAKVDIITQKDELVFRLKVDRKTGKATVVE